ncbi:response regulator [Stutzerimonas stutzeri]|uniref:response regulator n=1 Tax=Stutzerimonas stutzeri TaxID=316 RepID=UPI0002549721|nr:response regulator [Stutzerimonas stutzeri]EHY76639.1 histidine kinase-response regulator hybrid protein [Stutzerimonas stutzeri ATCC 14405 = CCUG 16156]QOZ97476.1 hybrid sensor histidine kinase/response regulator [Stutzerimonas stutzeri]
MERDSLLLIVDDNATTRYAMRRVLERHGYQVLEAGTGSEGLELVANASPDALILDVNLPDMSGFDIARQLRADASTALLPLIHVSAASIETNDIITGLDAGGDAYLIHPVDPDVLLATLRTLLRVRDTERALRDSEARFREIFIHVAAPIAVLDAELQLHECNHAFELLIGAAGRSSPLTTCFAPGQEAILTELRTHLRAGERWGTPLQMLVGGKTRETEWQISPYRTQGLGLVFVEDVTEQRHRERAQRQEIATTTSQLAHEVAERARTEEQLLQAQKMDALGKLTGGIAHDFNNLLTGIITGIELMKQRIIEGRADSVLRFADASLSSARSAASLTNRLLAFARKQPLDARALDINERIRSLEDLLRRTIGERITLTFDFTDEPAVARVDVSQFESALLNLVINARDALPEGGHIRISTFPSDGSQKPELAAGHYIGLCVSDDGTGIEPSVLDKVFDPFFTTKPQGRGTGLGLSSIYGFALQSGGDASIRSTLGAGTEVTLLLPAATGELPATRDTALDRSTHLLAGHEHVLVVEDMPSVRMLIAETLIEAGYRCSQAGDVETAQSLLEADPSIDLLLTDVGLPRLSGRQLAEWARRERPTLPVVLMTGYAENASSREGFVDERMELVLKPFEGADLLIKIRALLDEA